MPMKSEDLKKAVDLIVSSNNCKTSFNVPVKDNFSHVYEILIHECNADLINKLAAAEFSLSMNAKGLSVTKY